MTARFPGDPGVGNILVGANHGASGGQFTGYPIEWLDERIWPGAGKKHSTVREYTQTMAVSSGTKTDLQTWCGEGRVPMLSFKIAPYSIDQVASGAADQVITANAKFLASLPGSVFVTMYHEPEDNFTTSAEQTQYRAAFRHWRDVTKQTASNVAFASPMFMSYSFTPGAHRDFRNWHPNWDGSKWAFDVVDVDGIDLYNPSAGSKTSAARNHTWTDSAAPFLNARKAAGAKELPWVIGEHGIYSQPDALDDDGVTVAQIVSDMVRVGAKTQGLVGVCFWNSNDARFDDANDPQGAKVAAWRSVAGRRRVKVL